MPSVERPDGVGIHWESRGDGPLVVITLHLWSHPQIYDELVSDLVRDHRVVTYDPRGYGQSPREGPYDLETDAGDLLAVAEAAGGGAVALAIGSGFNRAARVATARPDVVSQILAVGPAAAVILPRTELKDAGVMAGSESVAELIMQMLRTDPRAAMRTIVTAANPELDDEQLHDWLDGAAAYLSPEAALGRAESWLQDDVSEHISALGDRLWMLHAGNEPLFEGALAERVRERFPHAHFEEVASGPVSRPDLYAAAVRRVIAVQSRAG
jgi:pimeloyl-ACP methyl ester carboxylesterase